MPFPDTSIGGGSLGSLPAHSASVVNTMAKPLLSSSAVSSCSTSGSFHVGLIYWPHQLLIRLCGLWARAAQQN